MAPRRLKNLEDIRRFLAFICRAVESDEMDAAKGGRLAYICNIMARVIENGDIEARLQRLEERIGK